MTFLFTKICTYKIKVILLHMFFILIDIIATIGTIIAIPIIIIIIIKNRIKHTRD